jgi:hypothetical protein
MLRPVTSTSHIGGKAVRELIAALALGQRIGERSASSA